MNNDTPQVFGQDTHEYRHDAYPHDPGTPPDQDGEDFGPGDVESGVVTDGGEPLVVAEGQLELGASVLHGRVGVAQYLPYVVLEQRRWLPVQAR
jgi:hypothetical protein